MCYFNQSDTEVEFDYYLSLAGLYDQGFPGVPHIHESIQSDKQQGTSPSPEESGEDEGHREQQL